MSCKRFEPENPPNAHALLETHNNLHNGTRLAPVLSHVVTSSRRRRRTRSEQREGHADQVVDLVNESIRDLDQLSFAPASPSGS